jgi:hypothetical protein
MRPGEISWDDLPADVKRTLGVRPPKKSSSRVTAWRDIPPGWRQCRPHGWAWMGEVKQCPRCEYPDGDGEMGNVEETRRVDRP